MFLRVPILFILLLLTSSIGLMPSYEAAVPVTGGGQTLNLGMVSKIPGTFYQSPGGGHLVSDTRTWIPYLPVNMLTISGILRPGMANVQTMVPGSNGAQWVVNLISANMKWSDGVPVDSGDLAYSFGIYLPTGLYANMSRIDFWGAASTLLKSVDVINSTAIMLTMKSPFPAWPVLSMLYAIYPYHYYKQFTGDSALQKNSILGGPGSSAYVPANYTAGSTVMTLVINPYSPSWGGKTSSIQRVNAYMFTDENSMVNSLAAGTIDGAMITPSDIGALNSTSSLKIEQFPATYQMFTYVRSTGYPFDSAAFRQALMYLINKDEINSVLYGGKPLVGNPIALIPQGMDQFWPGPETPLYKYDPNMAATLLKAAGLVQNSQGKWTYANGTAVTVNVEAGNGDPNFVRAAQFIANSMEAAGLQATPKIVDQTTADSDWSVGRNPAKFDVLVYWNSYAPTPYRWLRNFYNLPGWQNATFTTVFTAALADPNPTTSLQKLKQAELIVGQAAVINSVLLTPSYVAFNNQKFTNWDPAIQQQASYHFNYNPVFAENVLTSVQPVGPTATTGTTTGVAAPAVPVELIAGVIVLLIVAVAVGIVVNRRRRKRS